MNPQEEHWIMIKRVFRYLNGTQNKGIIFYKSDNNLLDAYVDASYYKDDLKTGRSTTGYLIRYCGNLIA